MKHSQIRLLGSLKCTVPNLFTVSLGERWSLLPLQTGSPPGATHGVSEDGFLWELFLAWQRLSQCPYFLLPAPGLSGSCCLVGREALKENPTCTILSHKKQQSFWNKDHSSVLCLEHALEQTDSGKQKRISYGLLGRHSMIVLPYSSINLLVSGNSFQILAIDRLIVLFFTIVVGFHLFPPSESSQVFQGTFRKAISGTQYQQYLKPTVLLYLYYF